ncbi:hypothetical protein LCGC14_0506400 [marine sediment metagenome]|uniref:Uncharacterized protein n=1 Tax=marine sediment metagenome TaxID=412755 RepID=A0A0F9S2G0_9ZZZZ
MKLVNDQLGHETNHIIINGNGKYPDFFILKRICEIYNGSDNTIIFPRTPLKNPSGLSSLRAILSYLDEGFRNLIFIIDKEHILGDANAEIKNQLVNINILNETYFQDAFLLECNLGHRNFNLFCSISGSTNCIEEELLILIKDQLNIQIDLPQVRKSGSWRAQLKTKLDKQVGRKKIKKVIKESGRRKLEGAFPNLCAIFREISRNYEINRNL